MKNMFRITALLLTLSMLSILIACADSSGGDQTVTAIDTTEAQTEGEPVRAHKVPKLDFEGRAYTIAYPEWQGYISYFFAEEQNGDVMNDSIYERDMTVEEYLNVDVEKFSAGNIDAVVAAVKAAVLANSNDYSQALLHCISGVSDLPAGGFLLDLDTLEYTDYSADWWNKEQMDVLRLGKYTYYGISDYMIPCPYVVYFNKAMIEDYSLSDPYQLVHDDKWTLDTFAALSEAVVSDVNGDDKWTIDDQYAVSGNDASLWISFMTGAGQFITEKNDEGRIELAINTEKTIDIIGRFVSMNDNHVFLLPKSGKYLTIDTNRVLFQLGSLDESIRMRDFKIDFGFLPYPKYDETQERFYSLDWGGLCCVPSTETDTEFVGAVMEMLAFVSGDTVVPTYYDIVLTGKLTRDEDTLSMLDIIFDTVCYEVGGNYFGFASGFNALFYSIPNFALSGSTDFASLYAKNEASANKTIDDFYDKLGENEQ